MDQDFRASSNGKPRVLVAPLDWGLGHATRCIPLIRELVIQGAEPVLAGEGKQAQLLSQEFPQLPLLPLKGYDIRYSRKGKLFMWKLFFQLPQIMNSMRAEHRWLKKIVKEHSIRGIISDGRYGLYHKSIPSVIINHQLRIMTGWAKWTENLVQKENYKHIERFHECWVPDTEKDGLAGTLSHPEKKPAVPMHYVGPLTRLVRKEIPEKKGQLLFIISGPEPQRGLFENKIINQAAHYAGSAVIVRGLPGSATHMPSTNMISIYNHLPATEFNDIMEESEFVIARPGYSTIMDTMALGKKCIFVPTPGQTEQEYLGRLQQEKNRAILYPQADFTIEGAMEMAKHFNWSGEVVPGDSQLKNVVSNFLSKLKTSS
jgi:UDP:flavonoid glycosyltransferase YjiC (YdhE family)